MDKVGVMVAYCDRVCEWAELNLYPLHTTTSYEATNLPCLFPSISTVSRRQTQPKDASSCGDSCHLNTAHSKVKVKVKFTLEQATKAQRGSRRIAILFP